MCIYSSSGVKKSLGPKNQERNLQEKISKEESGTLQRNGNRPCNNRDYDTNAGCNYGRPGEPSGIAPESGFAGKREMAAVTDDHRLRRNFPMQTDQRANHNRPDAETKK